MKTAEFIALSACTMMLTALGIDIMLPVFGAVRDHFKLSETSTATAQIVVFFFLGQIAQILFGILSDRFGRLAILRLGFPLYILGGLAATFAPSLGIMFAARFVAGMGASAVLTTTIAGVRDRFVGDRMARIMSLIFTVFLSTPVFAPFLGLAILSIASWRMVFLTPPLFAVIVFVWSLRLEESLPPEQRRALTRQSIAQSIKEILGNKVFLRYTAITTILFTGLSSWVSSSEHIVSEIYKRPGLFAWIFAGIGLWMALSTLTNSRLAYRFGARPTLKWLLVFYTLVAVLLLLCTFLFSSRPPIFLFAAGVAILLGINLAVEPNSSALAMEPMGNMAGLASSVYGTFFFFVGAGIGSVISNLMKESVFPIILGFFIIGIITLILAFGDRRPQAIPPG
jgi:DHA1 family bicyclomycin/chloramphenicol resistance-like MFS transporter